MDKAGVCQGILPDQHDLRSFEGCWYERIPHVETFLEFPSQGETESNLSKEPPPGGRGFLVLSHR